jgi:hypothetical protein
MELREDEIRALRFYEGDVDVSDDPFWSDAKAYVTLNSLLFEGLETETARTKEGRKLNPVFVERFEETISLCRTIDSLLHRVSHPFLHVYRVERLADYEVFAKSGYLQSFLSTSTAGYLKAYEDKYGLVLMEADLEEGIPCGDLGKLLPHYAKSEEAEVTLAPWLACHMEEIPLNPEDLSIRDGRGDPPKVHVLMHIRKERPSVPREADAFGTGKIQASLRVYEALNTGRKPAEEDVSAYLSFKRGIRYEVLK